MNENWFSKQIDEITVNENKEKNEKWCCPFICFFHKLCREVAYITENCAKHHACEKRRKAYMHRTDMEVEHCN